MSFQAGLPSLTPAPYNLVSTWDPKPHFENASQTLSLQGPPTRSLCERSLVVSVLFSGHCPIALQPRPLPLLMTQACTCPGAFALAVPPAWATPLQAPCL